jgi:hypothetical protein
MPFCPRCGLNVAGLDDEGTRTGGPSPRLVETPAGASRVGSEASDTTSEPTSEGPSIVTSDSMSGSSHAVAIDAAPDTTPAGPDAGSIPSPGVSFLRPAGGGGFPVPPIVIAAVFVMIGLIAFGLLTRSQSGGVPGPGGQPVPGATLVPPAPPIVGLTILSPSDGQVVAAAEVTVIGTAPPGVSITQDISFGLDQHASVDGTGHWAIKVGLNEGDNKLTFRIGDDRSTERTVRVTYTPQRTP